MGEAANKRRAQEKALGKGKKAARKANAKTVAAAEAAKTEARGDLVSAREAAIPELRAAGQKAEGELISARDVGRADLSRGEGIGRGDIDAGLGRGRSLYGAAREGYFPALQRASQAANLYGDFFGVGGDEGYGRAQSSWQSSPLYRAMVGEGSLGIQGLNRQAAARGNPYNATDLMAYDDALAGRYIGQHTEGLWKMAGQEQELLAALAGLYGAEAQMEAQAAAQKAGITMTAAQAQAELSAKTGQNLAQNTTNTGAAIAGAQMGTGQQLAGTSQHAGDQIGGAWQNQANREVQHGVNKAQVAGAYHDARQAQDNADRQFGLDIFSTAMKPLTAWAGS